MVIRVCLSEVTRREQGELGLRVVLPGRKFHSQPALRQGRLIAPRGSTGGPPFLGKPVSALIVGISLGLAVIAHGRLCTCSIATAFPGRVHRPFECPIKYHTLKGQCPGWTPAGTRIASCWIADDLTTAFVRTGLLLPLLSRPPWPRQKLMSPSD
jgi:hypothetical protein